MRFLPDIKVNYVYYYDTLESFLFKENQGLSLKEVAKKVSTAIGFDFDELLTPDSIRKQIDLVKEENHFVRLVSSGGRQSFVRVFAYEIDPQPSEMEMMATLLRLQRPVPKAMFVSGHYERDLVRLGDQSIKYFSAAVYYRHALVNQGFDVDTLSLKDGEVPADVSVLAIIDPRTAFTPIELERLQHYIDRGGNLMIAGEPGKQEILNTLCHSLPVRYRRGVLIRQSKDDAPDFIKVNFTEEAAAVSEKFRFLWKDSVQMQMPGAVGLNYADTGAFATKVLLTTNAYNTWNKMGQFAMDTGKVTYNPENGDVRENIPVALALSGKGGDTAQRILVLGDADMLNNMRYPNPVTPAQGVMLEAFNWFTHGAFPVEVDRPGTMDNKLLMKFTQLPILRWVLQGLVPGMVLISGVVLLVRRKRK